ncbi:cytochrome oxidase complex assembly protein 1-domain-containing protein [Cantharellus anzutake]|uniref:cytochrome oxidase complex assembly protein 1-domain-containing protein n=1 Tax=Cantharellus anzutake TaxID=1750568 RepID=UPI0019031CBA|nr:cytochrome oxidase complex assembly protein 1-domain-containing protein [Cantharellus anzutake]KAF8335000.1 cytochrome oxidase complex assembly protein 1-domain-containing protein [Cantharellus anzutake]
MAFHRCVWASASGHRTSFFCRFSRKTPGPPRGCSRPKAIHSRQTPERELPDLTSVFALRRERIASSVVRQIMHVLQTSDDPLLEANVGRKISMKPHWYILNQPYVFGTINLLQGKVDISFGVQGSEGDGTVYFSSIRKMKGQPFTILRFKIICDNGEIVQLKDANVHDA